MKKTKSMISLFLKEFNYYSEATKKSYRISLNQFFTFCPKEFDKVQPEDVEDWLIFLKDEGLTGKSRRLKLTAVRSFYEFLVEDDYHYINPTIGIDGPKAKKNPHGYLDDVKLVRLLETIKGDLRLRALIETLRATGARITEALEIKVAKDKDIDWDRKVIAIRKGKGKKEREVPFTRKCEAWLRKYLNNRKVESEYLFCNKKGEKLSSDYIHKLCREYSEKLDFKVTPHMLRYTLGATLESKDVPIPIIQTILGHENINTTSNYAELNAEDRKKQHEKYTNV
ncbi:tyrosine-type recombinase/integrase [Proteinivorax hydrogeniformans]|uniref:Tyrosine-type recombinase/integrase n=1 Tax=Proteinivorax hydrogeniformans TaxID=1826727 RepID=A0AAU8HPX8_9FIRM